MKDAWYVVKTNYVFPEAEKELIENMLCSHSENLTIAFGLISASLVLYKQSPRYN